MAENKEYMIHQEDDGSIQISEDVLASIASTTALSSTFTFLRNKSYMAASFYTDAQKQFYFPISTF